MICSIYNFENLKSFFQTQDFVKECIYDYGSHTLEEILAMTKDTQDSFVFDISNEFLSQEQIDECKELVKLRDNIKFRGLHFIPEIRFFYTQDRFVASDLSTLDYLCQLGVSDVYIEGQLGFELKNARKVADKYGVKLRAIPNKAWNEYEPSAKNTNFNLTSFWFRPEDLELFSKYIDVIEFGFRDKKQAVLHEIYFISKKWQGNLGTVIAGLGDFPNILPQEFAESRLNCGKKCILDLCHSCHKYKYLALVAHDKNIKLDVEEIE